MSEEQKVVAPETQQKEEPKVEVEKAKEMTFTQAQLDNIIKSRLEAEQRKHQRTLEEAKKKEEEAAKEKLVKEAKSKAELEKLMQQRIAEKDTEILKYKNEIKKDALEFGDVRRTPIIEREEAKAFTETELLSTEPVTIVLSKRGWMRAAKGRPFRTGCPVPA